MTGGLLACCSLSFLPVPPFLPLPCRRAATRHATRDNRQRSVSLPRHARFQPLLIRSRRGRVSDRVDGCAQRGAGARVGDVRQPIVDPQTVSPGSNEPRTSKVHEVPRHRRLRQPKCLMNVADTDFPVGQDPQNPKPGGIGESAVQTRKFMNPSHIATRNVPRRRTELKYSRRRIHVPTAAVRWPGRRTRSRPDRPGLSRWIPNRSRYRGRLPPPV